ncbi:MAG TPA: O-sialoglycoprotein endopeptidase [Bacillota bacterium]|nr:O-sialoglycoprotein endopeptidase [Bacillota bacterium]
MSKLLLGVDTSNYRTSLCLIDDQGNVVSEQKQLLTVKQGERGLRQSDAVFQHMIRLPELASKLFYSGTLSAVAVSTRPRPIEGSYMPVFKAGESWAKGIALFMNIPLFETSHQEMHIAAGEYSSHSRPQGEEFLAVHLSGGTSEILHCKRTGQGYQMKLLGGTRDLHAGQLIDRIGVALGLPFPAGPYLEKLADTVQDDVLRVPTTTREYSFHLSGAETALLRMIAEGKESPAAIARATEQCIAGSLEKVIRYATQQGYPKEILIVGGVAANSYIKKRLKHRLEHRAVGCSLYFADIAYSGDNAFGVARIGLNKWLKANDDI